MGMEDADFLAKYGFQKPTKDTSLVTHCMKGGRARKAGDLLVAQGYQARLVS